MKMFTSVSRDRPKVSLLSYFAVHYSAHRHGDGTWKAAKDCPVDRETGRLLAYVTYHGHGLYPTTGVHARVFLAANDVTADSGRRWGCQICIVLAEPGSALASGNITLEKLPVVKDRGAAFTEPYNGVLNIVPSRPLTYEQNVRRAAADAANDGPVPVENIQVVAWAVPTNLILWGCAHTRTNRFDPYFQCERLSCVWHAHPCRLRFAPDDKDIV